MNEQAKHKIAYLLELALEGKLEGDQVSLLNEMLKSDPSYAEYAVKYIQNVSALKFSKKVSQMKPLIDRKDMDSVVLADFLSVMAEKECSSPTIESNTPIIEVSGKKNEKSQISKKIGQISDKVIKLYVFASIAAILFFAFSVWLFPQARSVATVVKSVDVQWADHTIKTSVNGRLYCDRKMSLKRGTIKLEFDSGTEVIVDSPAVFELENTNKMKVYSGRVFARVNERAIGFVVDTPSSRVIDLGTEFGVIVQPDGLSSVHMVKGKAMFSGIVAGKALQGEMLTAGQAKKNDLSGNLSDIKCEPEQFVSEISSKSRLWHGQDLDLASIISGSDGFGSVIELVGIDPASGKVTHDIERLQRESDGLYNEFTGSNFIDGVFVPKIGNISQVVTSRGDTVTLPPFDGYYTHEITVYSGDIEKQHDTIPQLMLDGTVYDHNNVVVLHSNSGITFDLDEIRKYYPEFYLVSVKADCGITEKMADLTRQIPYVDFLIAIDGEVKYQKKDIGVATGKLSFDIPLTADNHYVTFVVTDCPGLSDNVRPCHAYDNDFFYLADPVIDIEVKSNE